MDRRWVGRIWKVYYVWALKVGFKMDRIYGLFVFYGPVIYGLLFFILFWRYNFASLYKCIVIVYLWDDAYIIRFRFAFVGF